MREETHERQPRAAAPTARRRSGFSDLLCFGIHFTSFSYETTNVYRDWITEFNSTHSRCWTRRRSWTPCFRSRRDTVRPETNTINKWFLRAAHVAHCFTWNKSLRWLRNKASPSLLKYCRRSSIKPLWIYLSVFAAIFVLVKSNDEKTCEKTNHTLLTHYLSMSKF